MEEEKKLYPFKFIPITDTYAWGSETFLLADLGYRDSLVAEGWLAANTISEVMDTYLDRVVGDVSYDYYGRQFPVQVKQISCKGKMPLRVHPSDELAADRYDALGREKFWYILKASPSAKLVLGFKEDIDAQKLYEGCLDGSLEKYLHEVTPRAGESYRIEPGTVHGAKGDLEIIEVSQSSALDFCIYSYGQQLGDEEFDPSLSTEEALDFINYAKYKPTSLDTDIFTVNKIALKDPLHFRDGDGFEVFVCLYGEAVVQTQTKEEGTQLYRLKPSDLVMVPGETPDFFLSPAAQSTAVLEILVNKRQEKDAYINPDVPEKLPEDEN